MKISTTILLIIDCTVVAIGIVLTFRSLFLGEYAWAATNFTGVMLWSWLLMDDTKRAMKGISQ